MRRDREDHTVACGHAPPAVLPGTSHRAGPTMEVRFGVVTGGRGGTGGVSPGWALPPPRSDYISRRRPSSPRHKGICFVEDWPERRGEMRFAGRFGARGMQR